MKFISQNVVNTNKDIMTINGSFRLERSPLINNEQEECKSNMDGLTIQMRRSKSIGKKKHKRLEQLSEIKDGMVQKKSKGKKELVQIID